MESYRFKKEDLISFCQKVFIVHGVSADDAHDCAEVLVAADARNIPSHGIARLKRYLSGIQEGSMDIHAQAEVIRDSPVSLLLDAEGALGVPVSKRAMNHVLDKAEKSGMAFACVRNSNHYGIAGYYAMMALERDMIGISMTNTAALGVPTFGRQVMFGTNPMAFAAPADKEKSFVLDMSTTVVTRGKIEVYDRESKDLVSGWAVDKHGKSVRQAGPLLDDMFHRKGGGIVPLGGDSEISGGHKGFGLAMMVDIMTGVLSGSAWGPDICDSQDSSARVSHCFGAMKIDLFMDSLQFRKNMDMMLQDIRNMEAAEGQDRVYFAGLKEFEAEADSLKLGVAVPAAVCESLRSIADEFSISFPSAT
ncbi:MULTISPECIES: Ldh family oxidoreductase [unclassified Oceanispirochaeta]|uniref:Ldh family oxidoreductase n=1 Tax=unclassified Oceanispirochaeta TaxID=2635722 RepID=UPI000E099CD6|nr:MULTISPECIES: Ldh family oxidoreductase [unclassified Oceanispirochaeta]MBF9014110.1 Ldh family oxidoreductase [Oceanispirochaeta sp. M2]NPD70601.1 Ldh family oxidoreductase [Oceanispirochaeta sp. M1]RDG34366.1 Ldh family oxidoreductase [Oceanispirochaeta sp. M1]